MKINGTLYGNVRKEYFEFLHTMNVYIIKTKGQKKSLSLIKKSLECKQNNSKITIPKANQSHAFESCLFKTVSLFTNKSKSRQKSKSSRMKHRGMLNNSSIFIKKERVQ